MKKYFFVKNLGYEGLFITEYELSERKKLIADFKDSREWGPRIILGEELKTEYKESKRTELKKRGGKIYFPK